MPKRSTSTGSLVNPYDVSKFKGQKISTYTPPKKKGPVWPSYSGPSDAEKRRINAANKKTLEELKKK